MRWSVLFTLFFCTLVLCLLLWYVDISYLTARVYIPVNSRSNPWRGNIEAGQYYQHIILPNITNIPFPTCNATTHSVDIVNVTIPQYLRSLLNLWPPFRNPINNFLFPRIQSQYYSQPLCSPVNLGPIMTPRNVSILKGEFTTRFQTPRLGGLWYPSGCRPHMKVAIMIPYRNRADNLYIFTHHMHYYLQQQMLDYGIFVIEQVDTRRFNRAKLFNAGYQLLQTMQDYDCLVLHDIDKMPEDTRALYHCDLNHPKQMPSRFRTVTNSIIGTPYKNYFGGVTSMTAKQYEQVNGMTNEYWGWGGEDDELLCRVQASGLSAVFESSPNAIYTILHHHADAQYSGRPMPNCQKVAQNMKTDGLRNTVYKVDSVQFMPLYTLFRVVL
jgi:hypothetical protein